MGVFITKRRRKYVNPHRYTLHWLSLTNVLLNTCML